MIERTRAGRAGVALAGLALAVAAIAGGCGPEDAPAAKGSQAPPALEEPPAGPVKRGAWTYYAAGQGLPEEIHDVSADEGGNVYVAGGDALYAKGPREDRFHRFDAANGGLTVNCNDLSEIMNAFPARPFYLCPVISVAGAAPGRAIVGLKGLDQRADLGSDWIFDTGGADYVSFDASTSTLSRVRHVEIASPPHVVCGANGEVNTGTCPKADDYWWTYGRRLLRQVWRIVVNHDRGSAMYGDVWFGGNHGTFAALLANAAARGWTDLTAGWNLHEWADTRDVWEHMHPAISTPAGAFLGVEGWALSLDPRDGTPWGSNGIRTAYVIGYGADLSGKNWWDMGPGTPTGWLDLWPDTDDAVRSMSHCPDGTLWIASTANGLARIDPSGAISFPPLPDAAVNAGASAIACDPADGALWIGLVQGGVLRLKAGAYEVMDPPGAPAWAHQPVSSIQLDRWSTPRVVYFAFGPRLDGAGGVVAGGGVGAYAGE